MSPADQELYEIAGQELFSNSLKLGLWTLAFAQAGGDESRAKAVYIELRVAELRKEASEQIAFEKKRGRAEARQKAAQLAEEQRAATLEARRRELETPKKDEMHPVIFLLLIAAIIFFLWVLGREDVFWKSIP